MVCQLCRGLPQTDLVSAWCKADYQPQEWHTGILFSAPVLLKFGHMVKVSDKEVAAEKHF